MSSIKSLSLDKKDHRDHDNTITITKRGNLDSNLQLRLSCDIKGEQDFMGVDP